MGLVRLRSELRVYLFVIMVIFFSIGFVSSGSLVLFVEVYFNMVVLLRFIIVFFFFLRVVVSMRKVVLMRVMLCVLLKFIRIFFLSLGMLLE